jgi:hypothetical protein
MCTILPGPGTYLNPKPKPYTLNPTLVKNFGKKGLKSCYNGVENDDIGFRKGIGWGPTCLTLLASGRDG